MYSIITKVLSVVVAAVMTVTTVSTGSTLTQTTVVDTAATEVTAETDAVVGIYDDSRDLTTPGGVELEAEEIEEDLIVYPDPGEDGDEDEDDLDTTAGTTANTDTNEDGEDRTLLDLTSGNITMIEGTISSEVIVLGEDDDDTPIYENPVVRPVTA